MGLNNWLGTFAKAEGLDLSSDLEQAYEAALMIQGLELEYFNDRPVRTDVNLGLPQATQAHWLEDRMHRPFSVEAMPLPSRHVFESGRFPWCIFCKVVPSHWTLVSSVAWARWTGCVGAPRSGNLVTVDRELHVALHGPERDVETICQRSALALVLSTDTWTCLPVWPSHGPHAQ